jgi:hypothetical protein
MIGVPKSDFWGVLESDSGFPHASHGFSAGRMMRLTTLPILRTTR